MCSIFGVVAMRPVDPQDVILYASILGEDTQHRGDAWVGIAGTDGTQLWVEKRPGQVSSIFGDDRLMKKFSDRGVQMFLGQTRFPTQGGSVKINAQPYYFRLPGGTLCLGSNGDVFDYEYERNRQSGLGIKHITTNDAELLLSEIWLSGLQTGDGVRNSVAALMRQIPATFSTWLVTEDTLYLFRDPSGNRPLFYMQVGSFFVFASEDCALQGVLVQRAADGHKDGTVSINQVLPGELIRVRIHGACTQHQLVEPRPRLSYCTFERIYLARQDSNLFGADNFDQSVYYKVRVRHENGDTFFDPIDIDEIDDVGSFRYRLGKRLAEEHPAPEAEYVVDIPDSGTMAALGFADAAGLPFKKGLVRNPYVGRTFISPGRQTRALMAQRKYRPMLGLFRTPGTRIVLVDDSIVFGTTSAQVMRMLFSRGAVIDTRISCPEVMHGCHYGVDMSSKGPLIAAQKTIAERCELFRISTLGYLSMDGLRSVMGKTLADNSCFACWDGQYPITYETMNISKDS